MSRDTEIQSKYQYKSPLYPSKYFNVKSSIIQLDIKVMRHTTFGVFKSGRLKVRRNENNILYGSETSKNFYFCNFSQSKKSVQQSPIKTSVSDKLFSFSFCMVTEETEEKAVVLIFQTLL